ncbi:MAG: DNA replication/repair protein RecF [Sphingomonas sp.]|uniref:DNA replication/repair protein RecF n=1 Tax=Sphingomonas sp. TaxID=28214 RepID=UPI00181910D0|nr:DNA replication/repair protein RecF [Sphingomonas sp.]MBA3667120.1 DNA replication/repair protein RecF [Sphingomonas sp.]
MPLTRLSLTDFRNHRDALIEPGPGFVLLSGPNGAGKTNVLEAVSLLTPGRGLRQVSISDMARSEGPGGFGIAAKLQSFANTNGVVELGTGASPTAPDRRQVRINGTPASVNSLSEWLSALWLTPAMDRLFADSAGNRRRFLDRLTLALDPGHATHAARYEAAMRARNKLLAEPEGADPHWLAALEVGMAEHGAALGKARACTVAALTEAMAELPDDDFPRAALALDGWNGGALATDLKASRGRDAAAGRATVGPHRQDLAVTHVAKGQRAARGSTGEQKALLLGLVLAHAELVADCRGAPPILLLDEVAAHLDPARRAALFARLEGRGQVWMTATEPNLFADIGPSASRFHVEAGAISPA